MTRRLASPFRARARGFTLVEVLAALTIFGVAVVALIQAMGEALSIQTDLLSRQRASMLAENVIEEFRYTNDLEEGEDAGEFEGTDSIYRWTSSVTPTDIEGLMEVTATINWNDGGGEKEYSLTTQMLEEGEEI